MPAFKIKGVVQNYDWGGNEYIPELIGLPVTNQKCAEYWMGAHDKAPSEVQEKGIGLNELIKNDLVGTLGSRVAERFGQLPFLFKVLDVRDMLSIQVHPTKREAEIGFQKENDAGIHLSAPNRNYKDANHKPEMMVALRDFWLLHGFKPKEELTITLSKVPELAHLLPVFESHGYKGLYRKVMEESGENTNSTLKPLIDRILPHFNAGSLQKSSPDYWAAMAFKTFCSDGNIDKGIYSIYLFNIVQMHDGEAIFQSSGVPHAYLEGRCVELMANSDNVLRGGLTPKHIDVPELMKHVDFSETIPQILQGEQAEKGLERIYKTSAPDFELSKIILNKNKSYSALSETLEIMIVMEGSVTVEAQAETFTASRGEVFVITAKTNYDLIGSDTILYKAKSPFYLESVTKK